MSRRRISAPLLACAAVAAILSGCGGGGGGNVDVGPAAAVPANTPIYIDAVVRPTGTAQTDAKAAASKILSTPDPGGKIISLIEQGTKANGHPINFQQDVSPWLGKEAGIFFTTLSGPDSQGTVVVESTNANAALAFARKATGSTPANPASQTYNGVSYQTDPTNTTNVFGTVGNFLVEGPLTGFKAAVDASKGDSLGDSSDFKDSIGDLPDDRLGTFYTVPKNLLAAIPAGQLGPSGQNLLQQSAGENLDKPFAGAVTATSDSIDLDLKGGGNEIDTPESSLLGDVPAQSWLALGIGNLGERVKQTIDQLRDQVPSIEAILNQVQSTTGSSIDELTGSLGDAVLYVQGTTQSTLSGALVIQTKNSSLTGRLLMQLQSLLQLGSAGGKVTPLQLSGGGTGFQINNPSVAPAPVEIAQQGDKLVVGYGANSAEQTLTPAQKLSDSPSFSSAKDQVSSVGTDFFLSFPQVFQLAESSGAKNSPGYVQAKPYIDALNYLVTGSGGSGGKAEFKAVVGLK
ncbi:MAG: DUF3352 domain-containing protein [Solirubrobacterales bacterium]